RGWARRPLELSAADDAVQPEPAHQPLHRAAGHGFAFPLQVFPDLPSAVALVLLVPRTLDLAAQPFIPPDARRPPLGIALPRSQFVVQGRGNRQHVADRLDPVRIAVRVDEAHHHFARRSSSAWAEKAAPLFRISLGPRRSEFLRSSLFGPLPAARVYPSGAPC